MHAYERSYTDMDRVSMFFPQKLGLGAMGQDFFSMEWSGVTPSGWTTDDYGDIVPAGSYDVQNVPATSAPTGVQLDDVLKTITSLIQAGQQVLAQERILDLNTQRARQGLPPVDPRYYSPTAGVNFGLTPQTQDALIKVGIVGLVAFMGFRMFTANGGSRSRRRR